MLWKAVIENKHIGLFCNGTRWPDAVNPPDDTFAPPHLFCCYFWTSFHRYLFHLGNHLMDSAFRRTALRGTYQDDHLAMFLISSQTRLWYFLLSHLKISGIRFTNVDFPLRYFDECCQCLSVVPQINIVPLHRYRPRISEWHMIHSPFTFSIFWKLFWFFWISWIKSHEISSTCWETAALGTWLKSLKSH